MYHLALHLSAAVTRCRQRPLCLSGRSSQKRTPVDPGMCTRDLGFLLEAPADRTRRPVRSVPCGSAVLTPAHTDGAPPPLREWRKPTFKPALSDSISAELAILRRASTLSSLGPHGTDSAIGSPAPNCLITFCYKYKIASALGN